MVSEIKQKSFFNTAKQSAREIGYKTLLAYIFMIVLFVAIAATFFFDPHKQDLRQHAAGPTLYLETFDGSPTSPKPITHLMDGSYDNAVFRCKDHLMTSIAGNGNTMHDGDTAIYLSPDAMADFTNGVATIGFDISTLRTSAKDWVDIWVTPISKNIQLPLDEGEVYLQGNPKDAITKKMGSPNADFNHDKITDIRDLSMLLANYGK